MGFLRYFNVFGFSNFINHICMLDYVYCRHLYPGPRYKYQYSFRYQNTNFYYDIENLEDRFKLAMETITSTTCDKYHPYYRRRVLLAFRYFSMQGVRKETNTVKGKISYTYKQMYKPYPFCIRLANQYYKRVVQY